MKIKVRKGNKYNAGPILAEAAEILENRYSGLREVASMENIKYHCDVLKVHVEMIVENRMRKTIDDDVVNKVYDGIVGSLVKGWGVIDGIVGTRFDGVEERSDKLEDKRAEFRLSEGSNVLYMPQAYVDCIEIVRSVEHRYFVMKNMEINRWGFHPEDHGAFKRGNELKRKLVPVLKGIYEECAAHAYKLNGELAATRLKNKYGDVSEERDYLPRAPSASRAITVYLGCVDEYKNTFTHIARAYPLSDPKVIEYLGTLVIYADTTVLQIGAEVEPPRNPLLIHDIVVEVNQAGEISAPKAVEYTRRMLGELREINVRVAAQIDGMGLEELGELIVRDWPIKMFQRIERLMDTLQQKISAD